jgi:hypothetical protein
VLFCICLCYDFNLCNIFVISEIKDQINYTPSNTSSSSNEQVNAMNISHQVIPTSSDGLHPAIHRQPLLPTPVFHHPTIGARQ